MHAFAGVGRARAIATLAAVAGFVILFLLAAREYPGGTDWDPSAHGHDLWLNFACDLTRRVALNGENNPVGSVLAQASMIVLAVGLFPLWSLVSRLLPAHRRLGAGIRVLGSVSAAASIAVVLMPSDRFGSWHAVAILLAGPPGIVAVLLSAIGLARDEARPRLAAVLGFAILAAAATSFVLYFAYLGRLGPKIGAVLEKLSLILLLVWMATIAVRAFRLGARHSAALALLILGISLPGTSEEIQRGWSIQGVPLPSYSTDEGFGYGARVQLIDHGAGDLQPYRYGISVQFFQTTKNVASHHLNLDAPAFLGSRNRIELGFEWAIYKFFPYYGVGNSSVYHEPYEVCGDRDALALDPDHCPGNPEFRGLRYYRYNQETLPRIKLNLRRDLGGPWKLFAGYRFRRTRIEPLYPADDLGQHDVSQFILDAQAGRLTGWDGSNPGRSFVRRTAELTSGLVYDGRDNEPAPTEGMFHEISLRGAAHPLGSEFDYWGVNATLRGYHWLFPGYRNLVAAGRVLFDAAGGDVPFHLLGTTGGLNGPDGVGGDASVRGLTAYRLQGRVKLLLNGELRWRFLSVPHFDFGVTGSLDSGRVWSRLGSGEPGPLLAGGAAGLRIAWNRNFVIRFDYGIGISEKYADGNIYLTFDEMF